MSLLPAGPDHLGAEAFSALGQRQVQIIPLCDAQAGAEARRLRRETRAILIGLHQGPEPCGETIGALDLIISEDASTRLPACIAAPGQAAEAARLVRDAVRRRPVAAGVLCSVLRLTEGMAFSEALEVESLAYSTLLSGQEFRTWLSRRPPCGPVAGQDEEPVKVTRLGDTVTLTLDHPASRNAMTARMRDALFTALAAVADDPTRPAVVLRASGPCFSSGGALAEFGTAEDLAFAHLIRTARSPALLLHQLAGRASVVLHGACIGSAIEIAAAAAHRRAAPGTFIQLPELHMGLIPGAGGTVSLSRAIGRHRTAWLALSGRRVRLSKLAGWGLVNQEPP